MKYSTWFDEVSFDDLLKVNHSAIQVFHCFVRCVSRVISVF